MKVLFVDDTRDTRDFFRFAFELEDIDVRLAGNGRDAVEMVSHEPFDAIIIDVEMPEMSGWDAARAIRLLGNGRQIPIVMYTAYNDGPVRQKASDAGADAILFKPLLPREILSRIRQIRA
ncbi:MAG TPA: response regulator [Abditibacteriaceae bacterium]|jgi:CheY-like chemotaxis protein